VHDVTDFRADDFVSPGDISVAILSDCKESTKVIAVVSCVGQLEGTGRLRMGCAKGPCFRELVQLLKFPRLWIGGSLFFQKRPDWYDFDKDKNTCGLNGLSSPRRNFSKLAVLVIPELRIPPMPVLFGSVSIQIPSD
jgi:hypothetical protein